MAEHADACARTSAPPVGRRAIAVLDACRVDGASSVARMVSSVDLPAPFGPEQADDLARVAGEVRSATAPCAGRSAARRRSRPGESKSSSRSLSRRSASARRRTRAAAPRSSSASTRSSSAVTRCSARLVRLGQRPAAALALERDELAHQLLAPRVQLRVLARRAPSPASTRTRRRRANMHEPPRSARRCAASVLCAGRPVRFSTSVSPAFSRGRRCPSRTPGRRRSSRARRSAAATTICMAPIFSRRRTPASSAAGHVCRMVVVRAGLRQREADLHRRSCPARTAR